VRKRPGGSLRPSIWLSGEGCQACFLLRPYGRNVTSSVVKTPKLYWSDVGIARHLTGSWGPCSGHLFETLVVAEAVKLIKALAIKANPAFYRTRSGLEIDMVLETAAGVIAIEVKSRERWAKSDFQPLELFAESVGDRFRCGLVVTKGGRIEAAGRDGRFWAVPFHRLFS